MARTFGPDFRWEDLEIFLEIARGLRAQETLEEIGARLGLEDPRTLQTRLGRLEKALGLTDKGLVERCKYDRHVCLSFEGTRLLDAVQRIPEMKKEILNLFNKSYMKRLIIATNVPALIILSPELVKNLIETRRQKGLERRQESGEPHLGFRPEFLATDDYAEAASLVSTEIADIALFARSPVDAQAVLPRSLERENLERAEILLSSRISVLTSGQHPFRARQSDGIGIEELGREHIVARPFYRFLFQPPEPKGGWTPVSHSADVHAYVRAGIGVGLNTQFGFQMLSEAERLAGIKDVDSIVEIPLNYSKRVDICLLRKQAKKRRRNIGDDAEMFVTALKAFYARKRKELG
jgi:hypothetical protein